MHHGVMTDESWPPPALPPDPWVPVPAPPQPADPHSLRSRVKRVFAPLAGIGAFLAKFGLVLIKLK
jgi:hypothetical protein